MAAVIASLREMRALVDAAGPPLVKCPVCNEYVTEAETVVCTLGHALCGGCARQLVQGLTEDPRAMGLDGAASVSLGGSDCYRRRSDGT